MLWRGVSILVLVLGFILGMSSCEELFPEPEAPAETNGTSNHANQGNGDDAQGGEEGSSQGDSTSSVSFGAVRYKDLEGNLLSRLTGDSVRFVIELEVEEGYELRTVTSNYIASRENMGDYRYLPLEDFTREGNVFSATYIIQEMVPEDASYELFFQGRVTEYNGETVTGVLCVEITVADTTGQETHIGKVIVYDN